MAEPQGNHALVKAVIWKFVLSRVNAMQWNGNCKFAHLFNKQRNTATTASHRASHVHTQAAPRTPQAARLGQQA